MAEATDLFQLVGNETATNLSSPYTSGGATVVVGSTANWPTTTGVTFAIDTVTLDGTEEVQVPGTYTLYRGKVTNSTTISDVALVSESPNPAQNYAAGSLTRVYMPASAGQHNRMVEGLLTVHNQDGTLKAGAVDNAAVLANNVVTTSAILDANVTTTKIADGAITNAKLSTTAGELGGAWISWTPTLTNFTGTVNVARYKVIGKTCWFYIEVTQGASVTGRHTFSLPVEASASIASTIAFGVPIARGLILDLGTQVYDAFAGFLTTTTVGLGYMPIITSTVTQAPTSATLPMVWANGSDKFWLSGTYEVA